MAEKGIDMAFRLPESIESARQAGPPHTIVSIGGVDPKVPGDAVRIEWDLPEPAEGDMDAMRHGRDEIEKRVSELIQQLKP